MAYAHEAFASDEVQTHFKRIISLFLGKLTFWGQMQNDLTDLMVSQNFNYVRCMQIVLFFLYNGVQKQDAFEYF